MGKLMLQILLMTMNLQRISHCLKRNHLLDWLRAIMIKKMLTAKRKRKKREHRQRRSYGISSSHEELFLV